MQPVIVIWEKQCHNDNVVLPHMMMMVIQNKQNIVTDKHFKLLLIIVIVGLSIYNSPKYSLQLAYIHTVI